MGFRGASETFTVKETGRLGLRGASQTFIV